MTPGQSRDNQERSDSSFSQIKTATKRGDQIVSEKRAEINRAEKAERKAEAK